MKPSWAAAIDVTGPARGMVVTNAPVEPLRNSTDPAPPSACPTASNPEFDWAKASAPGLTGTMGAAWRLTNEMLWRVRAR